jgi:hypothetical protein
MSMQILISGASVAGPVLAYWLSKYGLEVTVVERAATLRKTGGHAVDLFRRAMQIVTKIGLLEQVRSKATGTDTLVIHRAGAKPVTVDLRRLYTAISDDHLEIMRDDLSEIFYDATRDNVEYVFADSITSISDDGEVAFEDGPSRRFDVIVGADGLHSDVRALTFGPEAGFSTWIGAYLSVVSMPNFLNLDGVMETIAEVGRIAGVYSAAHLDDARAVFLFRTPDHCSTTTGTHPGRSSYCVSISPMPAGRFRAGWPHSMALERSTSTRSRSCDSTPGHAAASRWWAMQATARGLPSVAAPARRSWVRTSWRESSPPTCRITAPRSRRTSARSATM